VDAILVGEDKVLTRDGLNTFYRMKGFNPEQIVEFNEDNWNLDEIVENPKYESLLVPLATFSPGSVVPEKVATSSDRPSPYLAFNAPDKKRVADKVTEKVVVVKEPDKTEPSKSETVTSKETDESGTEPEKSHKSTGTSTDSEEELLVGVRGIDDTDFTLHKKSHFLDASVNELSDKPLHIQIQGAHPSKGILYDDTIHFNDSFDLETAEQITQGLRALKAKKLKQSDPSNIKIVINSPGGDVRAAQKITNALDGMGKIKTDVIVNGRAASCGAWLLASATGNKLATPQARIMIHQPSISFIRGTTYKLGNQSADNINRSYKHISGVISKATGRDRELVEKDLNQDTWMNPLEAMFYGSLKDNKGLLDGILVGSNQAITRQDVLDYLKTDTTTQGYLTKKFGPDDNVAKYLESRLDQLTKPKTQWKKADEADPFNDPVRTIMQVAARSARNIDQIDGLKASATRPWTSDDSHAIDQFVIGRRRTLPVEYWNSAEPGEPISPGVNPGHKHGREEIPAEVRGLQ
jgi:ATP-dependent Clp protease protease subunit